MTILWRKVHQRSLVFMQVLFSELEFEVLDLRRVENQRITLGEKREPQQTRTWYNFASAFFGPHLR